MFMENRLHLARSNQSVETNFPTVGLNNLLLLKVQVNSSVLSRGRGSAEMSLPQVATMVL